MIRLLILFILAGLSCQAATYYVDFDGGDDTLAGTSQGTAWKTIPGTRNVGNTDYVTAGYGPLGLTITTITKVQPNDTFMLRRGTVHNSSDGGRVLFSTAYYSTAANTTNAPITIKPDITWDSGPVEFNGVGITMGGAGNGLIHITVGGIVIDGVSGTNGIIIAASEYNGVSAYPGADIQGPTIRNVFFGTNGTTYSPGTDDASEGDIHLLRSYGGTIADCTIMGGGSSYQGMCFGESHLGCRGYVVTNCYVEHLNGSDDGGIGYKALNSQIYWVNCTATRCYKGWDLGEINGDGSNILYQINGATSYSNIFGINMNGAGGTYAGTIDFQVWNSLVITNGHSGLYIYSGPYNVTLVHNTVIGNGALAQFEDSNLVLHNDPEVPTQLINAYVYNNIFYKPYVQNYYNHYFQRDVIADGLNLNSDNNSWVQRASEQFAAWSQAYPPPDNSTYTYGANGPGHASGNWYNWYSGDTTAPANGRLGHFHADGYSKGTGATDTTEPPFAGPTDYRLSSLYGGTNISSRSWYLSAMGVDRNGRTRTNWDIGALEYDPNFVPYRVANPGKIKGVHFKK